MFEGKQYFGSNLDRELIYNLQHNARLSPIESVNVTVLSLVSKFRGFQSIKTYFRLHD